MRSDEGDIYDEEPLPDKPVTWWTVFRDEWLVTVIGVALIIRAVFHWLR